MKIINPKNNQTNISEYSEVLLNQNKDLTKANKLNEVRDEFVLVNKSDEADAEESEEGEFRSRYNYNGSGYLGRRNPYNPFRLPTPSARDVFEAHQFEQKLEDLNYFSPGLKYETVEDAIFYFEMRVWSWLSQNNRQLLQNHSHIEAIVDIAVESMRIAIESNRNMLTSDRALRDYRPRVAQAILNQAVGNFNTRFNEYIERFSNPTPTQEPSTRESATQAPAAELETVQ